MQKFCFHLSFDIIPRETKSCIKLLVLFIRKELNAFAFIIKTLFLIYSKVNIKAS